MIYSCIKTITSAVVEKISRYRRLLIALLWGFSAAILSVVLWRYNPGDNSLFYYHTGPVNQTSYFRVVGSQLSAFLVYFFGAGACIFVPLLGLACYKAALSRSWKSEWDRLLMFIVMLPVVCALLSAYSYDPFFARCPGGYCGIIAWTMIGHFFDKTAATGMLIILLLMAVIIISRFPFIEAYHYSMKMAQFLYAKRYLLAPCLRAGKTFAYWIAYPFILTGRWLYRLIFGAQVAEINESIFAFEYDQEEIGFDKVGQDSFWKACKTGMPDQQSKEVERVCGTEPHEGWEVQPKLNRTCEDQKIEKEDQPIEKEITYLLPDPAMFINQRDDRADARAHSELEERARILEEKLEKFGISGKVIDIKRGPVVTIFEYQPQIDTKLSKIVALEDDLAMALQALSIRIIAPIPGRDVVGFEVSNNVRHNVLFGSIIQSKKFRAYTGALPLILGSDTIGNDAFIDLAKMPHLLIAGSTGSGKSVALNTMLVSLLCRCTPDELRLVLIDPKRLEFASYDDMGHLLFPIITDPKQAILALRWVVKEMERRYEIMKELGARNIADYNKAAGHQGLEQLPFIAIFIDELSDLMITAGRDIEDLIVRITQMARAAGIHMVVATQRPSVDVITGLIKVNFPSRISFRVTSKVDSRTILDCSGAEKLLGRGDMLFLDAGSCQLHRVHGAYVSDAEIEQLVASIKVQREPHYCELTEESTGSVDLLEGDDQLYKDIVVFLDGIDEVSISLLQRRFRIGYNRSARIIDMLEAEGVIAPSDGSKMRKVIH